MKQLILSWLIAASLSFAAHAAHAACYADYKAKQDNPLRLHYGVAQISACSSATAQHELSTRLSSQGWTLMTVVSIFDDAGLAERKPRAGQYFLRF